VRVIARFELLSAQARDVAPGVTASAVVAVAAAFLSEQYRAPAFLMALLLGMAMNFLAGHDRCRAGLDLVARGVLRIGVALLGIRITLGQALDLGWQPLLLVGVAVLSTILLSMAVARAMGFQSLFGLLTGGATAICGASAALALAAALPNHPGKERATLYTVIGVSILSTVAMVVYPTIAHNLHLSPQASGVFIGATIHDVAQVIGAGYAMSRETGDVATMVKLLRIGMLLPVIACAAMLTRARASGETTVRPPLLPWFALAFAAIVLMNSAGWIGAPLQAAGTEASRWCLLAAMAAIGMKTQLRQLTEVGFKPALLMLAETVFLAVFVLGFMHWTA